jgi:hypothetical protein
MCTANVSGSKLQLLAVKVFSSSNYILLVSRIALTATDLFRADLKNVKFPGSCTFSSCQQFPDSL